LDAYRREVVMARYTQEFKDEAVALYKTGRCGLVKTADQIGIATATLSKWIKQSKESEEVLDINEREQLRQAKRELAQLREENDILKKAAAFFAAETTKTKR
jgi:transposase